MTNSKTERSTPQPHKVMREMSLFLGKFEPQPNNAGWAFQKNLSDASGYIRVSSRQKVSARDGLMFDFVMSTLFAQRRYLFNDKSSKTGKLIGDIRTVDTDAVYGEVMIDLQEVLRYRKVTNDFKNKKAIFDSLRNMVGMTVEMKNKHSHLIYSLLTSVRKDDVNPNILYVKINSEMNNALFKADMRFINAERALPLRSDIAIEFTKFLQTRGAGLGYRNAPKLPREFSHEDAVHFLHLEHLSEDNQIRTIRKAIKSVGDQGFATYQMKRFTNGIKWIKEGETEKLSVNGENQSVIREK